MSEAVVEPGWMAPIRALVGKEYGRILAWDAVNEPMIRQWCEIMGLPGPQRGPDGSMAAPAAMLQVWCMEGPTINNYPPGSTTENPYEALALIEAHGYPAVVAVNSELTFERDPLVGERLYYTTRLADIGPLKTTALGTGYFVTLVMGYFSARPDGDEKVGEQLFRVFKFKPAQPVKPAAPEAVPAPAKRPVPGVSDDTRFFWDGARAGKLLIQRCCACLTLRHPPGPVCSKCHSFAWDTVTASGKGRLYSFVVAHYPVVAPFEHPNPVGLVELDEGTRLVAQLVGVDRAALAIGQRLQVEFNTFDDDLVLPQFRPAAD